MEIEMGGWELEKEDSKESPHCTVTTEKVLLLTAPRQEATRTGSHLRVSELELKKIFKNC